MTFCKNCGKQFDEELKFLSSCGTAADAGPASGETARRNGLPVRLLLSVCGIGMILIFAAAGSLYFVVHHILQEGQQLVHVASDAAPLLGTLQKQLGSGPLPIPDSRWIPSGSNSALAPLPMSDP